MSSPHHPTSSSRVDQEAIDRWQTRMQSARSNEKTWSVWQQRMERREAIRPLILSRLNSFLDGSTSIEDFRREFDSKARSEWDCYGLGGASGGMWLNKLVKHIPDKEGLAQQVRTAFRVPKNTDAAIRQASDLDRWLDDQIRQAHTTRGAIQPARAPLLLSAFWHFQAPQDWPIAYPSLRSVFQRDNLLDSRAEGIEQYLQLRAVLSSLVSALGAKRTDIELVCFHGDSSTADPKPRHSTTPVEPADSPRHETPPEEVGSVHAEAQFVLATIAQKLGLKVWIARNDRGRSWNGTPLGGLSLQDAPSFGADPLTQRSIELIDVLWIKGKGQVVAAFEVESTTSIYSGLLRMSDLAAAAPNISFPLYIVVPEARMNDVRRQLRRPTFQQLELHSRCGFFSIEELRLQAPNILRFGGGPDAIDALASRVSDVADDEDVE